MNRAYIYRPKRNMQKHKTLKYIIKISVMAR